MTKSIVNSVRSDVSAQMEIIQRMAEEVQRLYQEADAKQDDNMRRLAQHMASQLRELSEKAYSVGEKVLEAA